MNPLLERRIRGARAAVAAATAHIDALENLVKQLEVPPPQPKRRKHGADGWSEEEDALLRVHYPAVGAIGCVRLLPHRSYMAIRSHAHKRGITTMPAAQKLWCDQCDAKVTRGQIAGCKSPFCHGKKQVASGR